ncbi:MAG: hypothetical protein U5K76_12635 [Woeseiaceae bacterium]|nr:hypothetical protein [Woeseiaceae bacterium]
MLILLTDGANTAGQIDPVKAAELAAQIGLQHVCRRSASGRSR